MLIDDGTRGLSRQAIGAAIRIHKKFGPGLLEQAYRVPFVYELEKLGFSVECERPLPLIHETVTVQYAYRPDMVIQGRLVIELKSVQQLAHVHIQQLRTYLRLSGIGVGLLINFNVPILRHGIRRVILDRLLLRVLRSNEWFASSRVPSSPWLLRVLPYRISIGLDGSTVGSARCASSRWRNSRSIRVGVLAFGFQPRRRTLIAIRRRPSSSASLQLHM